MDEDENNEVALPEPQKWGIRDGRYVPVPGRTTEQLPAGMYDIANTPFGLYFYPREVTTDDLITNNNNLVNQVLRETETFWAKRDRFKELGFTHRRGYLFYGAPGCGKSCLLQMIQRQVIANDGLVFHGDNPSLLETALDVVRSIEPSRRIINIFEDVDTIIRHSEEELLQLLDGDMQQDYVLNLATTNYLNRLPARIRARPRRFDRVIEVPPPDRDARRAYFQKKLGTSEQLHHLELWVAESDGLPFGALAELVILVECFDHDISEASQALKKTIEQCAVDAAAYREDDD